MSIDQHLKPNNAYQTFRKLGQSTGMGHQNQANLDEALNSTNYNSLRYSNLVTTSFQNQSRGVGIICPTHSEVGVYKCQICSGLRQVCPKTRTKIFSKEKREKSSDVTRITTNNLNTNNYTHETAANLAKNTRTFSTASFANINGRTKEETHNFIQQKPVNINWTHTSGTNLQETTQFPNRESINLNKTVPNLNNLGYTFVQAHQNTFRPPSNRVIYSRPGSAHFNQQSATYTEPRIGTRTRFIEEIIYVPVIHNIIKPQIINNPEYKDFQSPFSKTQENIVKTSHYRIAQPETSPIKTQRRNEAGILTPEAMRKLAESIIR